MWGHHTKRPGGGGAAAIVSITIISHNAAPDGGPHNTDRDMANAPNTRNANESGGERAERRGACGMRTTHITHMWRW